MRAGKLDRRIDIQRNTPTTSDSGEPVDVWANLRASIPASWRSLSGDEQVGPPQTVATDQVEFTIHYAAIFADLSPLDRIVYPAQASGNSPAGSRTLYDILLVSEIGRRDGLKIIATRKPDET